MQRTAEEWSNGGDGGKKEKQASPAQSIDESALFPTRGSSTCSKAHKSGDVHDGVMEGVQKDGTNPGVELLLALEGPDLEVVEQERRNPAGRDDAEEEHEAENSTAAQTPALLRDKRARRGCHRNRGRVRGRGRGRGRRRRRRRRRDVRGRGSRRS